MHANEIQVDPGKTRALVLLNHARSRSSKGLWVIRLVVALAAFGVLLIVAPSQAATLRTAVGCSWRWRSGSLRRRSRGAHGGDNSRTASASPSEVPGLVPLWRRGFVLGEPHDLRRR